VLWRIICRWVPSPQSNNSRSPSRLTMTALGARWVVGTAPLVPRNVTRNDMVRRQPSSDKPPSERESSELHRHRNPVVADYSFPNKYNKKIKPINHKLHRSIMQLTKRRLLKTSVVLATTATIAGCSGGQSSTDSEPQFELQEVQSLPSIAQSEEEITAAATVENTGNGSGSTSVEFSLDVNQSAVETETINSGETTQITTDIQVPIVDSGRYDLTASLNDQISTSTPVDIYRRLNRNGLHGSVVSKTGESLVDSRVYIISTNQEFASNQASVNSTERFFLEHLKSGDYNMKITFYAGDNSAEFSEIPDIAPLQESYTVQMISKYWNNMKCRKGIVPR